MKESGGATPLAGLRIAVTRPGPGAGRLASLLGAAGATPVMLPVVEVAGPADFEPVMAAAARLDSYDWLIFTSANAVRAFQQALSATGGVRDRPARLRVAAAGEATAAAVHESLGWRVDTVPQSYSGAATAAAILAAGDVAGARMLWPRARDALDALPAALRAAGASLDAPEAYRTVPRPEAIARLAALMERGEIEAVTLTSPSCVQALAESGSVPATVVLATIGPATAQAARAAGFRVHVQAEEHTIHGMVAALIRHFGGTHNA